MLLASLPFRVTNQHVVVHRVFIRNATFLLTFIEPGLRVPVVVFIFPLCRVGRLPTSSNLVRVNDEATGSRPAPVDHLASYRVGRLPVSKLSSHSPYMARGTQTYSTVVYIRRADS